MPPAEPLAFRLSWIALLLTSLSILAFGVVLLFLPSPDAGDSRALGVASLGMGLFGAALAWGPFRRRERWAWIVLGYLPLFWLAHLAWSLPPGKDHVHQIVLLALSALGLAVPARAFFQRS